MRRNIKPTDYLTRIRGKKKETTRRKTIEIVGVVPFTGNYGKGNEPTASFNRRQRLRSVTQSKPPHGMLQLHRERKIWSVVCAHRAPIGEKEERPSDSRGNAEIRDHHKENA